MEKYHDTKFITGLRGYAAMFVVMVHTGGFFFYLEPFYQGRFWSRLANNGKYGVVIFFVLSAYTICMSIERMRQNNEFSFRRYYIRRIFRIVPMYYFALICGIALGGVPYYYEKFGVSPGAKDIFLHITFLNIFDVRYLNTVLGVEWTIPIEMAAYIFLPAAFLFAKKSRQNAAIVLMFAALLSASAELFYGVDKYFSHHWSLENYAFSFSCGIMAYLARNFMKSAEYPSVLLGIFIFFFFYYVYLDLNHQILFFTIWTSICLILCGPDSAVRRLFFENIFIQVLGKISFSIYLVHLMVFQLLKEFSFLHPVQGYPSLGQREQGLLSLLLGSAQIMIVVSVALLAYYLIERPGIQLGRKIEKRFKI